MLCQIFLGKSWVKTHLKGKTDNYDDKLNGQSRLSNAFGQGTGAIFHVEEVDVNFCYIAPIYP